MKINIQTYFKTEEDLTKIFGLFNKEMFYYLTKNAPVNPMRYDGDDVGSEIHLQLTLPWKDLWVSTITKRVLKKDLCFFIDQGTQLPFNLHEWEHKHIVRKAKGGVIIEDAIKFKSSNWLMDFFWWFSFIPQFLFRKVQYKKYLNMCLSA